MLMTMNNTKQKNSDLTNEIDNFLIQWNNQFPIDRWWRVKHNVAFGSIEHKQANFIQMFLEFREDKMIAEMFKSKNNPISTSESSEFSFDDNTPPISKKEIDEDFENLNLEDYNEKQ